MTTLKKLGFNSWFRDQVDLTKPADFKTARVISASKNSQRFGRVAKKLGQLSVDSFYFPHIDTGSSSLRQIN